jgi:hypothetical protein
MSTRKERERGGSGGVWAREPKKGKWPFFLCTAHTKSTNAPHHRGPPRAIAISAPGRARDVEAAVAA